MRDIHDVREQAKLQRALEIALRDAVQAAIDGGLEPINAWEATKNVYEGETRLERSRQIDARSY